LFGKGVRKIGGAKGVKTIGHGGQRQRAALGQLGERAFEISHDARSIRKFRYGLDRRGNGRPGFSGKPAYHMHLECPLRQ
jgi:hypothetical protein